MANPSDTWLAIQLRRGLVTLHEAFGRHVGGEHGGVEREPLAAFPERDVDDSVARLQGGDARL